MQIRITIVRILLLLAILPAAKSSAAPWKSLFDGKTLDGWIQRNGEAPYVVSDGCIVGTTVLNTPNSFLCTQDTYRDFIMEVELKVDPNLNSGIQIRSNSFPEYNKGRVHGYQIEIDPSSRAWSGGIYDEARRGWLNTLEKNQPAQRAFKPEQWNHYRIEAIGDIFKTWINGVPASHLVDDQTAEGFIALQVHGIGHKQDHVGLQVRWRNIRIITDHPADYAQASPLPVISKFNQLTITEEKGGWKLLWDGSTTKGWRGAKLDHFPEAGWDIKDGVLTVLASGGEESANGGDIVTLGSYGTFELKVDFKITPGANSGIKYFVDPNLNKSEGSAIGLEYQILDDEIHPDAKLGNHAGSRTLASLYDLIKAQNKFPNLVGHWNHARIVSRGNHVEHWLNGRKVLEFERKSPEYRKLVANSKYKKWPGFGELPEGNILLQDHGNAVSFRNIRIKTD